MRLAKARLRARLAKGNLEDFRFRGTFDVAHCFVSTFKYLMKEKAARDHLRCMARALAPGGIYLLGFHLSDYSWPFCQHERWVCGRDGVKVVCNIRSGPPERARRRERCRARMVIDDHGLAKHAETNWWFRTYDADDLAQLRFVRRAQAIGFSLEEVRTLVRLREAPCSCVGARAIAEQKLEDVRARRAALEQVEAELRALVAACDQPEPDGGCPALRRLYDEAM